MLSALFQPESVAVIGASRSPGKVGYEILANLIQAGYAGRLVPVNPSADSILDIPCFKRATDAKVRVDLAMIAVPPAHVKAATEDAIAAGARAVCVITAGFKEVNEAGAQLESEIRDLCARQGVRLLGPNCLGLINTHHRMNASFAKKMPAVGHISVFSQSGAICTAILDWAAGRHLGLAKLISMGNKADLNENDFLVGLSADPDTRVIVGYLESILSGNDFLRAAETATARKPVIVLKSGVTQAGAKAASSHTGSLAGADMAYGAAFGRSGIIRADTFEALFDYATAFAMQPLPKGNRVAIVTNAGGPGIMAADAVEQSGMTITTLGHGATTALREKLPAAASVGNPIDVLGDAPPERYVDALVAAQSDKSVDAIVVIFTPQAMTRPAETARAIAACADGSKPILVSFMGGQDVMPGRAELVAAGLPDYPAPERAVAALKAMCDYAAWLRRPPRVLTRFLVNRRRVERIVNRHVKTRQLQMGEAQAKAVLRAYRFPVAPGEMAVDVEQALDAADRIGFPVAMKIASPDVVHKSDLGGVKLNLDSPEEVRDAFDLMMLRMRERVPNARLEGVYIERMCPRGREVILGMTRDPQFGPMLMFGLGGIFVEVMKDVAFHLAPITREEAMQMLESTRSFALLKGVRGQSGVDVGAIAVALQRISQLVTDFPRIAEMDINPFIVGPPGGESVAADARITLNPDAPAL